MRLGLGTVQCGLDYGISNTGGKTPQQEVARILECAVDAGIDLLDTAALYGDSGAAIGAAIAGDDAFRLVTKTPVCAAPRVTPADAAALRISC